MFVIVKLQVEKLDRACVTDSKHPVFSFALSCDRQNVELKSATICVNDWKEKVTNHTHIIYAGQALKPFTSYTATVNAESNFGEIAEATIDFEMGRMDLPWTAKWVTDGKYVFKGKKISPRPLMFKRQFDLTKPVESAKVYCTAIGIYDITLNNEKVGEDFFAPGFTSYKHNLQYQTYDVSSQIKSSNTLVCTVAGGWAVGAFTYARRNKVYSKQNALLMELRIVYKDGTIDTIVSDDSFFATTHTKYKEADFYDGEVYDSTISDNATEWHSAKCIIPKIKPAILAQYGLPVRKKEQLTAVIISENNDRTIYDFGQNFAGIISARIKGRQGQKLIIKHSEILHDGELYTKPLRSAKARIEYICSDGEQEYSPKFTYMGFRYCSVEGISKHDISLTAYALYSDLESIGEFNCSNEKLNQLQSNIVWSAKSNFVDIPTDCPQRDERMGWTGDIAVFAPTAVFNFDMTRFLDKWLKDLRVEQKKSGGVPVTIPSVTVYKQLEMVFTMAVDFWGDSCIFVPWAQYLATGNVELLREMYPVMKKYLKACKFWAELFSFGKHRRIWSLLHHYGDWVAPNLGLLDWMRRGKWTATACFARSTQLMQNIAKLLGKKEDAEYYQKLSSEIKAAYISVFTDGKGRLKKEFQTAYVLPLYFDIFDEKTRQSAADNLLRLVEANNYNIATGFPGTPYILFALCDNGKSQEAYKMLLNETCPSWLYAVNTGATTMWERWDALKADGQPNDGNDGTNGMVSYNHYALGAVGDFLYRRIGGLECDEGGYKRFTIKPVIGGGLTNAKIATQSPYGRIESEWRIESDTFTINVVVPIGTVCKLILPDTTSHVLGSGKHEYKLEGIKL